MTAQIAVTNESTVMTDDQIRPIVAALQRQVQGDFGPIWNTYASVQFFPRGQQPADWWWLGCFDDSDQAGALGYHDVTPKGLPLGKAFLKTDLHYGASPSVTLSHELLEMLGDPEINVAIQVGATTFYAYEACDPCEADKLGYLIDGVMVSDFLTPQWFRAGGVGPFDFRSHIRKPLTLIHGGHQSIWTPHGGWTQKTAEGRPASYLDRARVGSRRERRRTPRADWLASTVVPDA